MDQIDLGALRGPLAVVHFPVLPAFDGPTVAAGLAAARARLGLPDEVVAASCDYFIRRGNALLRPHELSVIVESDVDAFVAAVKRCAPANAAAFLLPPILGRTTPSTVVRALSKSLGVPCGETVAGVPSLPGLRLQEALTAAVGTAAVDVIAGECQAKGLEGPFEILTAAGGVEVPADSVVLATGRFIGGGIRRDLAFAETIFNLPVFSSSERLDRQFIGKLLDRRSASGHEAFRAGLRIDDRLRPLTASGDAASSRLFAAGSVISGYDPAFDKTGLGVAIFTGYLAGLAAAG
jgi:glycerol-3-phosphate dehydrogenase subunit B